MKKSLSDKIGIVVGAISAIPLLWVLLSLIEVASKNLSPDPVYSPLNLFVMLASMM